MTFVTTKYDTLRCENQRQTFRVNRLEILLGIDYLTVEICLGCSRNEARAGSGSRLIIVSNSFGLQRIMAIYGRNFQGDRALGGSPGWMCRAQSGRADFRGISRRIRD